MNIGEAVQVLKDGGRVARSGWKGKSMWLSLTPGRMVKADHFWSPHNAAYARAHCSGEAPVLPYVTMKTAGGEIVPWLCSQTDLLAEDWEVV